MIIVDMWAHPLGHRIRTYAQRKGKTFCPVKLLLFSSFLLLALLKMSKKVFALPPAVSSSIKLGAEVLTSTKSQEELLTVREKSKQSKQSKLICISSAFVRSTESSGKKAALLWNRGDDNLFVDSYVDTKSELEIETNDPISILDPTSTIFCSCLYVSSFYILCLMLSARLP